ncbi:polyribonucleotide nucleotidyltransferase [Myxococcota bacterium]|nr:polyribonucleotide nucleotidyltransferase [Myxococcota bacterium]MBU1535554.1 polyribonucleotide nucleotidyltransferase [Myxococcota bacterium]
MHIKESVMINGRKITIETGKIAKQADGAVLVRCGDSVVLVTAVASNTPRSEGGFLPLTVDYVEKSYAAGKIPGNYFKREGRLSEVEILNSRMIDRPIRPLFPEGWFFETQIMATVLSHDKMHPTAPLAQIGASAALHISDIPFHGPIAGVQVARVNGNLIAFPTMEELAKSDMDISLVASADAIVMVEGELDTLDEDTLLEALFFGQDAVQPVIALQNRLREMCGREKRPDPVITVDQVLKARVEEIAREPLVRALSKVEKLPRYAALDKVSEETCAALAEEFPGKAGEIKEFIGTMKYHLVRSWILKNERLDKRDTTTVRPIESEVSVLPMAHGSALFTRGETQALVVATLGYGMDNQKMDLLTGEEFRSFMLHYNFPPFSVGEARMVRGPGRREIGHGHLAYRAISKVLPSKDDFPYVIRVVSEITESNGSSSMATVCGATLALMDSGVPIKAPVAGIAMGLIKEGDDVAILTDILGDEDHLGDMDFKVAGTATGINAVQMDIKIEGLSREIMKNALYQAREGRLHILGEMAQTMDAPRAQLPPQAPRIYTLNINPDKIRDVIGPGGKVIRGLAEDTGAKIDIVDSGLVTVVSSDENSAQAAINAIRNITREPEIGEVYEGHVVKIIDKFGAIVEFAPNWSGLIHISELDDNNVAEITDVVDIDDKVVVKVIKIDSKTGKIRLSRRKAFDVDEKDIIKW